MSVTLLKRSSDPDVKLLAQDITLTQQAQIGQMQGYDAWIQTYERTKDPILAGDAALAAGSGGH